MPAVTEGGDEQSTPHPMMARHGRDLTVGSIPRHLVLFTLPMLAGNVLQFAYSFVNAIWVGHYLLPADQAAVANSFPLIFVLMPVALGLTMASSILASQRIGARDWVAVRKVVQTSALLVGLISIALAVIGFWLTPTLMSLLQAPPDVYPRAVVYMRVFLCSLPFAFGMFLLSSLLRGAGDSTTPLIFQAVAVVLNGVLDPLFMLGWLGFPRLGIAGAAVASVIAQVAAFISLSLYLRARRHPLYPEWRRLRVDWPTGGLLLRIGLPSVIQQSLVSLGMVFVQNIVNGFGTDVVAAFGFAGRIDQLAFFPAMSMNAAVTSLTGQNYGARKFDRIRQIFWWGVLMSGAITTGVSLLAYHEPGILLRIFTNDQTVIGIGVTYLHIVSLSYILFAIMFISSGIINGAGHTFYTTIISLVSVWLVRVSLARYLVHRLGDERGVWYAMAISYGVALLLSLGYYFSGRWKIPVTHRPPAPTPAEPAPPLDSGEQAE
jgi:putative MATE family efflux protein